jgi:hypothetical protein
MTSQRLTVQEAAEVLETSVDAVRMRARRGSLRSEKGEDGRVYVWVNPDESETKHEPNGEPTALISAKDETIAVLREQLEAEREAHREARRIVAGLVQRIPELEAPPGAPAPSQTASEAPQTGAESEQAPGGADVQKSSEAHREPWYKRWFG